MKPAEFEEKEFEGPLYRELLCGNHRIATPGQVFENAFGLDAVLEALHLDFWNIFGYPEIPRGVTLNDFRWGWVWRRFGRHRSLPTFQVNLLVQAKRPDHLRGVNFALSKMGIKGEYWRFKIREHQQVLLEQLERQLRRRALVVYAAPAFHELTALYGFTESKAIVENSSFVRPTQLCTHHCWNYDRAGSVGVATSEPEAIRSADFNSQLKKIISESETVDPKEALISLEKKISRIVDDNRQNPIAQYYQKFWEERSGEPVETEGLESIILSFLKVSKFLELLNTTWLVAGKDSDDRKQDSGSST